MTKDKVPAVEIVGETCTKPLPKVKKVYASDGKSMWYETSEHCPLYPNHNTRADGSCIREDFCPGRNDPKCLVKGGEKMGKKKTVKREAEEAIKNAAKEVAQTAPEPIAAVTTDRILVAMKDMEGDITSTRLRDAFGTSRGYMRRLMKQLAKEGKVTIEVKGKKQQVYKLV